MQPAPDPWPGPGRAVVRAEMEQARQDFHSLLRYATPADLRRASGGTQWTNQQLLFHMLFGYAAAHAGAARPRDRGPAGAPGAGSRFRATPRHALPHDLDPFSASYMTLADIYRYPTLHFRFHQRQLTLGSQG